MRGYRSMAFEIPLSKKKQVKKSEGANEAFSLFAREIHALLWKKFHILKGERKWATQFTWISVKENGGGISRKG
jgi:hypothetical protein